MRGFWIAFGLLAIVMFSCTASFLSGQTGLVLPLFVGFYFASIVAAYFAGRSVDIQSPFRPRHQQPAAPARPAAQRPAATNGESRLKRLQRTADDEFA